MGEDAGKGGAAMTGMAEREQAGSAMHEPEEMQREIEQTREQLGETVEALARKTDVKAQARHKLEETKASVSENPLPLVVVGALVAGFLAWRLIRG
jgi:ElaB/YqjD/DUF883 family membrane-anchored ribosome-binding protein